MEAQKRAAWSGGDNEAESGGADDADGGGDADATLDLHDVLEALSAHLHEHHDALVRWPWKLFCAKWARLIDWAAAEEERKEQERIDREYEKLHQGLGSHVGMG